MYLKKNTNNIIRTKLSNGPKSLNLKKFVDTLSSLQNNKTKLFFVYIIKTFEYLNTHMKKIF